MNGSFGSIDIYLISLESTFANFSSFLTKIFLVTLKKVLLSRKIISLPEQVSFSDNFQKNSQTLYNDRPWKSIQFFDLPQNGGIYRQVVVTRRWSLAQV